jgi:hypothetical protein
LYVCNSGRAFTVICCLEEAKIPSRIMSYTLRNILKNGVFQKNL